MTYATKDLLQSVALPHTSVFIRVRNHTSVTCATRDLVISVTYTHTRVVTWVTNHSNATHAMRHLDVSVILIHTSALTRVRHGHCTHVRHAILDLTNSAALTHTISLFTRLTDYTSVTRVTCHLVISLILTDTGLSTQVRAVQM